MNPELETQKIRELIATWMQATAAGDLEEILNLMAEDVVFLLPGQPPMIGKESFARVFRAGAGKVRIDATANIKEIHITDGYAFCWNQLVVAVTPLQGGSPQLREGNTLTIFRREEDGRWVLFRDANLLTPV